jgi:hypothetical protein
MSQVRRGFAVVACIVLMALLALTENVSAAEVRTWTDVAGRKTEAKFVRIFNGEVILEKDGRMLKVPLARFSGDDQKYIREQGASPAPTADAASKTDAATRGDGGKETKQAPAKADEASAGDAKEPNAKAAVAELRRMRDWRDNSGNVVKARFERVFGSQVVLGAGNRLRTIDFSRLSAADQEFLRRNLEAQGRAAEVPSAVASAPAAPATVDATPTSPPANVGPGAGFPGSSLPTFGDMASRMRQHQEQIRATQDQLRSQVKQMHEEMRAAREQAPRPSIPRPTPAESAPLPTAVAGVVGSGATSSDSTTSSNAPPAAPDLTSPHTPPGVAAAPARDPFAGLANAGRPERATPGSPFERNRTAPTSSTLPSDPFAAAPSIEPRYQEIIICGSCNKEQKPGFKAGQRCQHCGKTIDEIEDESGNVVERSSSSTRRNVKFWVWAVIAGISVVGGLIAKLRGG